MTEANAKDYWESLHRKRYGLQSVGYVGVGTPFNAWMYRLRRQLFLQAVPPFIPARDNLEILDVGSGTGFYLDRWRELGFRSVHASDVSEVAVQRLRERYPTCEVAQLDIGDESAATLGRRFDVVSTMDVLFHITSDRRYERAFANLASLVKPNGLLVFSENFVHQRNPREAQQVNRSLAEIEFLLRKVGFEPLARRPMFVLMNHRWTPPAGAQALLEGAGADNGGLEPARRVLVAVLLSARAGAGRSPEGGTVHRADALQGLARPLAAAVSAPSRRFATR
jgi:2-polyprenyl-3-methyl-5-hydroxy-6-metoxy-1,4-benzoquinol methylase